MNRREALTAIAAAGVAAAAPSVTVAAAPWRVFRVSDYEWYVARSPLEALLAAARDWGCNDAPAELEPLLEDLEREGLADEAPEELSDAGLDALKFADVDEFDRVDPATVRTFREELAQRIADGLDEPEMFAASEW